MKFTDEQRLIVMMLADIQKGLNIRGDFNPDFISKAAAYKDEFAIAFEYSMLFDQHDTPEGFKFVIDVLDMWSFIERRVAKLSQEERDELKAKAGIWGEDPKFAGFDGNNETELMSYTRMLVDDLRRFTEFEGRDFNSHFPAEDRYRAMYAKFQNIRPQLAERSLTVDELAELLTTR